MRRVVVLVTFLSLASAGAAQEAAPSPAASPSVESEYELVVGGASYPVELDGQADVKTAGGETVAVRLQKRKIRAYTGDGLTFQFSGEMSLKREAENELVTITLDHPDSPHAIVQLFPVEVTPSEVPKSMLTGLAQEFKDKSAKQTKAPGPKSRAFGDAQREGLAMEYQVASETIVVECYAWKGASRTIAVTLQYAADEAEKAEKALAPLTGSIR